MHIPKEGQGRLTNKPNNERSVEKCLNSPPTKAKPLALYISHKPYNKKTRKSTCYSEIIKSRIKLYKSKQDEK